MFIWKMAVDAHLDLRYERINLTRRNFRRRNSKIARMAEIPHLRKLLNRQRGGTSIANAVSNREIYVLSKKYYVVLGIEKL